MTDAALKPFSLIRIAKERLDLSDDEIARQIGTSRPHVQAVVSGRYAEALNPYQVHALLAYCRLIRDQAVAAVDELEMLS